MADLPKFIRQHFWENNWSKRCDLSKFPMSKLQEIADSFSNLDIKSKSAVIFTFANSCSPLNEEVSEIVEKVINMALADENSYIRSAATVLQCRSPLNCLCFDLSDTNQEFFSTLNVLLEGVSYNTTNSKILPMSEFFSEKVSYKSIAVDNCRKSDVKSGCLNANIGFNIKGQTPATKMKDIYLEKLHEECERRRVHVPIPGRSFAKSETAGDATTTTTTSNSQIRRAPSFPRRAPVTRKADLIDEDISTGNTLTTVPGSSARARLLAMHSANASPTPSNRKSTTAAVSGRNGRDFDETISRRPALLGANTNPSSDSTPVNAASREDVAAASSSSSSATMASNKRANKIKLLDFNDLPAIGIEAKRQKKEQQEKAREERRKQKEQEMEEKRQAREEARRAKLQASQSKKTPLPMGTPIQAAAVAPGSQHHLQPILQPPQIRAVWSDANEQPTQLQPQQQWVPYTFTAPGCNMRPAVIGRRLPENFVRQQQLQKGGRNQDTSASHHHSGGEDDEEEDDLEEDGGTTVDPDGTFAINAPRGFRGFADVLPSSTVAAIRPQQQQLGSTTIFLQRPGGVPINISGTSGQIISQMFGQQQQQQLQPRFRLVRPWSTTTPTSTPVNVIQASSVASSAPQQQESSNTTAGVDVSGQQQRFVQMADGLITLANTATAAAAAQQQQQQTSQPQQQTVFITNAGARIQMAATPAHIQAASGTPQPIIIRTPNLAPVSSTPQGQPQQTATFVISPSLTQVSAVQAPRLQPRLIQIRPRTPLSTATPTSTVATTNITPVSRSNAPVPIILPSGVTVASGLQPQPKLITVNAGLRPVAPAGLNAHNQQQQLGYTRIIPRPPLAPATVQKQISSQPIPLMPQPLSKEDLNLTPTQVTSIQSLFQGANRLSRLDKATILSFISGKAVNPQPDSGTSQRIHLSEYRERVVDKESGSPMDVAVDTFLLLDYATGRLESFKSYRTLPPDQLMALPLQPKVVPSSTTFVTTTSAS